MAASKTQSEFFDNWQRGKSVTECNLHMLETEDFADVTFLVGSEKHVVRAHRYVLASRSCVFHAMFCGRMAEQREVTIPDIEVGVFRDFLRFLYTDLVDITQDNAVGFLYASRKYDVDLLFEKSTSFLENSLSEENLCGIVEELHGYGETDLEQKALSILSQAGPKVTDSPSFRSLCTSCFGTFIKSETLKLKEEKIFEAVMSWTKAECERQGLKTSRENTRKVLGEMVYEIRFANFSFEFLTKIVRPTGILSDDERIRIMDRLSDSDIDISPFKSKGRGLEFNYLKRFTETRMTINKNVRYHAISFSVNREISLVGCQIYGSDNFKPRTDIEVCVGQKRKETISQLFEWEWLNMNDTVNDVMFPSPVSIQAGCVYTIYVRLCPSAKVEGCGGQERVCESGAVFTFSKTNDTRPFSSVENGQIPGLIWKHAHKCD